MCRELGIFGGRIQVWGPQLEGWEGIRCTPQDCPFTGENPLDLRTERKKNRKWRKFAQIPAWIVSYLLAPKEEAEVKVVETEEEDPWKVYCEL